MRILIVTSFFPPLNSIASLRPYSWAKWWTKAGHDVTVVTTYKRKLLNDLNLDSSFFKVLTVPIPFITGNIQVNNTIDDTITKNKKSIQSVIIDWLKPYFRKFQEKTGCFSCARFPDFHDLWAMKVNRIIKANDYDMVISTGGPYSTHRVGYYIKTKNKNIKWVVDWRDYWTKSAELKGLFLFRPYEKYLESKFHKNADLITTVSEPFAETIRTMTKTRVITIFNGFDTDDFIFLKNKPRLKNDRLTFIYAGTIYRKIREPSPLFKAVMNLDKAHKITPSDLKLIFIGNNANVMDLIRKYEIMDYYEYMGFIARENAIELQYNADIGIFWGYDSSAAYGVLTGKLFEMLNISKEIWAIGLTNKMQAGDIIEKTNSGYCFGNDVELIEKAIIDRLENRERKDLNRDFEQIGKYSRKVQAEILLDAVKEF